MLFVVDRWFALPNMPPFDYLTAQEVQDACYFLVHIMLLLLYDKILTMFHIWFSELI